MTVLISHFHVQRHAEPWITLVPLFVPLHVLCNVQLRLHVQPHPTLQDKHSQACNASNEVLPCLAIARRSRHWLLQLDLQASERRLKLETLLGLSAKLA